MKHEYGWCQFSHCQCMTMREQNKHWQQQFTACYRSPLNLLLTRTLHKTNDSYYSLNRLLQSINFPLAEKKQEPWPDCVITNMLYLDPLQGGVTVYVRVQDKIPTDKTQPILDGLLEWLDFLCVHCTHTHTHACTCARACAHTHTHTHTCRIILMLPVMATI